jgi:nitroreductase
MISVNLMVPVNLCIIFKNFNLIENYIGGYVMLKDLVAKGRSIRRFYGDKAITNEQLRELVEFARLSPSGGNLQPIKYALVCTSEMNEKVYETLSWAGYLKDWDGPIASERPTGYIIMLRDKSLIKTLSWDEGIFAQSIFLGASEMGLGGCIIGNIKRDKLSANLNIGDKFEIALVIALGYPKENVILENIDDNGSVKYWRDEQGNHHVPKRSLEDLIVKEI